MVGYGVLCRSAPLFNPRRGEMLLTYIRENPTKMITTGQAGIDVMMRAVVESRAGPGMDMECRAGA